MNKPKIDLLATVVGNQVRMGGTERFDGEEHNGSNDLARFAAVW